MMVWRLGAIVILPTLWLTSACSRDDRQRTPTALEEVDVMEEPAAAPSSTPASPPVYETIEVEAGGAVTGTVRLAETIPPLPDIPVLRNQAVCGEHRPDPSLQLGSDNAVANVVVSLVGIRRGRPMEALPEPAKLDQVDCEFVPHVQTVPVGTTLEIINSDPVLHNVHAFMNETEPIFNLAMPIQGYRIQRTLDVPGVVKMKCDAGHTWMSAYIIVQEHPYYSVTEVNGSYSIEDIPPGSYRLKLWHGLLGESEVPVEIEENVTATVDLELNAPVFDPS